MRIYFATWNERGQNEALTKKRVRLRLLSFWFFKEIGLFEYFKYREEILLNESKKTGIIRRIG